MTSGPWWVAAVAALIFGCLGFLAVQVADKFCQGVEPFEDGPKPGKPPVILLVGFAALFGLLVSLQDVDERKLIVPAIVAVALVACAYSDILCGIVFDYFTLLPAGLVLLLLAFAHEWAVMFVAAVVVAPFALAALLSKGLGMGWGDVKLVALGALVLGFRAILALAAACLAAALIAAIRKRRTEPVAFAPYLSASIALAMALPVFPGVI